MTLQEYLRQQALSRSVFLRVISGLMGLLPASPTPSQWQAFLGALYPPVYRGRMDAYRIAERFYQELRNQELGQNAEPFDVPRRNYGPEDLQRAMRATRGKLDALPPGEAVPQTVIDEATGTLTNQVLAGSRHAIRDGARNDPQALGYARVATGSETCAFCILLVSRGPVYKTRNTALLRDGAGEPYHPHCDCEVVPVFRKDSWPGREQYVEAKALWEEHKNLNALRDYLNSDASPKLPAELQAP